MNTVNITEMRNITGGKTYTYYKCKKCSTGLYTACASSTLTFWHVVFKHNVKLGKAWSYIQTVNYNY